MHIFACRQNITAWFSQSISDNSVSNIWEIKSQIRISLSYRNCPWSQRENGLWGIEKESPGNQNHITRYSDALTLAAVTICLTKVPYNWKFYFGSQFQVHRVMEVMVAGTWGYLVPVLENCFMSSFCGSLAHWDFSSFLSLHSLSKNYF